MFNGTIYIHSHKETGKCYVGQTTKNPETRWRLGYKCSRHFQNAINKHGWDAFDHQIIVENVATQEELDNLECLWIACLQSTNPKFGYNSESGGSHGRHSAESCKKMSESQKRIGNRPPSSLGLKRSAETKARMPHGDLHHFAKMTSDNVREIRQIKPFNTAKQLAERFGVNESTIDRIVARQTWKHI